MNHAFRLILLMLALTQVGCATVHHQPDERDPLERYNRAVHAFNDDFDRALFRPLARGYNQLLPKHVNTAVSNFFHNINDVWVMLNNLLQGKPGQGLSDMSRVMWNTTVGIGGLFDVASHLGLPRNNEDFGQTLGVWGVGPGPYFVLPFLGPSTIRDTGGRVVKWYGDPTTLLMDSKTQVHLTALDLVDTRAGLLGTTRILESAALDPYSFMRDAYLQRREYLIHDGNPPQEHFDPFADDL